MCPINEFSSCSYSIKESQGLKFQPRQSQTWLIIICLVFLLRNSCYSCQIVNTVVARVYRCKNISNICPTFQ